jgi:hypothetical protein
MTRRWPCILIVACCLLAVAAKDTAAQLKGNEFQSLPDNSKLMYVVGILDGWDSVRSVMKGEEKAPTLDLMFNSISRCVEDRKMTRRQTFAIVEKFMRDNPAKWHEEMAVLIWSAFNAACQ